MAHRYGLFCDDGCWKALASVALKSLWTKGAREAAELKVPALAFNLIEQGSRRGSVAHLSPYVGGSGGSLRPPDTPLHIHVTKSYERRTHKGLVGHVPGHKPIGETENSSVGTTRTCAAGCVDGLA